MATSPASASAPSALTLNTPATLDTETADGTYLLWLDLNNMAEAASQDRLVVRFKCKIFSAGTSRLAKEVTFDGDQVENFWLSDPMTIVAGEIVFEIEQTLGTGRSIPWKVIKL